MALKVKHFASEKNNRHVTKAEAKAGAKKARRAADKKAAKAF